MHNFVLAYLLTLLPYLIVYFLLAYLLSCLLAYLLTMTLPNVLIERKEEAEVEAAQRKRLEQAGAELCQAQHSLS